MPVGREPLTSALTFQCVTISYDAEKRQETTGRRGIRVKRWCSNPEISGLRPARVCLFHMKPTHSYPLGFIGFLSHCPGAFKSVVSCIVSTNIHPC